VSLPLTLVFLQRLPMPASQIVDYAVHVALLCILLTVFLWTLQREAAAAHAARWTASEHAERAAASLERLRALVQGMVPGHAVPRALDNAALAELKDRIVGVSGEETHPASDEARLRDVSAMLHGDHGGGYVDDYSSVVLITVALPAAHGLEEAWPHVCAALDDANERFAPLMPVTLAPTTAPEDPIAVTIDSEGHNGLDMSRAVGSAVGFSAPQLAPADDDSSADSQFASLLASAAGRQAVPLRLLEQCGDRVVVAGPLILRRDGADAAAQGLHVAAAATAVFVQQLAARVPQVAFGIVAGDTAGAVLGRGALRYGVYGVLKHHAADLAEATATIAQHTDGPASLRIAIAAMSPLFASLAANSAKTLPDNRRDDVRAFLSNLRRETHPWALRNLGCLRPLVWTCAGPTTT